MNNKIWTIIKREYLTRVRNKTFILSTFLTPILFAAVIGIIIFITVKNSDKEMVAVIDSTGIFKTKTDSSKSVKYILDPSIDTANYQKKGYTAVLYSPQTGINHTDKWMLFSRKNFGVIANDEVNNKIGREYENNVLLQEYKIGESQMDSLRSVAKKLKAVPYIGKGDKFEKGNSAVAYGPWLWCGISHLYYLIYIWCHGYAGCDGRKSKSNSRSSYFFRKTL
jgi:ABC-2 type transport system permease protein